MNNDNDMNDDFIEALLSRIATLQQKMSNQDILDNLKDLSKSGAFVYVPERDAP